MPIIFYLKGHQLICSFQLAKRERKNTTNEIAPSIGVDYLSTLSPHPCPLSRADVKQEDLVLAWQCLGNMRLNIIRQAEDKMLELLFDIATEQAKLQNILQFAMHQITSMAQNATEEEKSWFMRHEELPQNPSLLQYINIHLSHSTCHRPLKAWNSVNLLNASLNI
ncbi:hypothetical protein JOM56_010153 [Amanita muscaria]